MIENMLTDEERKAVESTLLQEIYDLMRELERKDFGSEEIEMLKSNKLEMLKSALGKIRNNA